MGLIPLNRKNNLPITNYKKVVKYGIPKETNKREIKEETVEVKHRGKNGRI